MIDISGDKVRDLPCVQQASYLEGGPLMWMLPLYLHVNQKSNDDDEKIYFFLKTELLQNFKPEFSQKKKKSKPWKAKYHVSFPRVSKFLELYKSCSVLYALPPISMTN